MTTEQEFASRLRAAVLAERERCAKIVLPPHAEPIIGNGNAGNQYVLRRQLAAAIRSAPEETNTEVGNVTGRVSDHVEERLRKDASRATTPNNAEQQRDSAMCHGPGARPGPTSASPAPQPELRELVEAIDTCTPPDGMFQQMVRDGYGFLAGPLERLYAALRRPPAVAVEERVYTPPEHAVAHLKLAPAYAPGDPIPVAKRHFVVIGESHRDALLEAFATHAAEIERLRGEVEEAEKDARRISANAFAGHRQLEVENDQLRAECDRIDRDRDSLRSQVETLTRERDDLAGRLGYADIVLTEQLTSTRARVAALEEALKPCEELVRLCAFCPQTHGLILEAARQGVVRAAALLDEKDTAGWSSAPLPDDVSFGNAPRASQGAQDEAGDLDVLAASVGVSRSPAEREQEQAGDAQQPADRPHGAPPASVATDLDAGRTPSSVTGASPALLSAGRVEELLRGDWLRHNEVRSALLELQVHRADEPRNRAAVTVAETVDEYEAHGADKGRYDRSMAALSAWRALNAKEPQQ